MPRGRAEMATKYLQPNLGMIMQANMDKNMVPRAQKNDSPINALPRHLVGKNSQYKVDA